MARFLVLDGYAPSLQAWDALLTMDGHEVTAYTDARTAIAALLDGTFDVVFTDARSARAHVEELVQLTRRHQPEACLFVASERRLEHRIADACRVFEKPVSYQGIAEAVEECPARRGAGAAADCRFKGHRGDARGRDE
jgi:DNA-binding NtrC family response regulator